MSESEPERKRSVDLLTSVGSAVNDAAAAAATTGAAALASGSSPHDAAIQAAGAAAGPLLSKMVDAIGGLRQRRARRWLVSALEGKDPDEVTGMVKVLEDFGHEEWVQQVVLDALRRVDEAIDDAVIPALGRLARSYLEARRSPDAFFRGLSRSLTDFSSEEYATLRSMLSAALASKVEFRFFFLIFDADRVTLVKREEPLPGDNDHWEPVGNLPGARHVSQSLVRHGLGIEPNAVGDKTPGGWLKIDEDTVKRLAQFVR